MPGIYKRDCDIVECDVHACILRTWEAEASLSYIVSSRLA